MKRNLLVRAGAIAMVVSVAFFSIVPDLVNAEGEAVEPLAEIEAEAELPVEDEAAAEAPEAPEEAPSEDASAVEAPETSGEDTADIPDTSVPDAPDTTISDTSEEVVTDGSEVTEPDKDTDVSEPDTEEADTKVTDTETPAEVEPAPAEPEQTPVQEENGGETSTATVQPAQTDQTVPDTSEGTPTDDASSEMDTIEDYLEILAGNQNEYRVVSERELAAEMSLEGLAAEDDMGDFVIEGTTVVGYNGAGGYIAIPEGITAIGDNAFLGNTSIIGISFPSSLQIIGSSAFNGCSNLESVNIPESVTAVGSSAFANCTGLAAVGIGASTGTVSQGEFYNCSSLTSVTVPEGISSVAFAAFGNCSNLSSVSLPSTLASLDMGAFTGDINLASISVASGSYASYDGCVYSAGGAQLLLCPQGKTSISFASSMQSIASGAFSGCSYLLSAVIPNAATTIEANAFSSSAIKAVTIPAGVTSIGAQASWSPSVIYGYSGSEAETWANANGYVFESLDGSQSVDEEETTEEHIEDEDPDPANDPDPNTNTKPGGTKTVENTPTVNAAAPTAAVSQNVSSHVKDATPKTGVSEHKLFFLFGAFFLMGIACFTFSRKMLLDAKMNK